MNFIRVSGTENLIYLSIKCQIELNKSI